MFIIFLKINAYVAVFFLIISTFNYLFIYLFIYLWLCCVFVSVRGLPPVAASGGHSSLRCAGLSLSRPLLLRSTGSRRAGSVIVAHGPSCSAACGILPDQGSNPCPLHWQADSQPLHHQGSPQGAVLMTMNHKAEREFQSPLVKSHPFCFLSTFKYLYTWSKNSTSGCLSSRKYLHTCIKRHVLRYLL